MLNSVDRLIVSIPGSYGIYVNWGNFAFVDSLVAGRYSSNFKSVFPEPIARIKVMITFVKLLGGECHRTHIIKSRNWLREWLSAIRQLAITWAIVDPDLCRHMASLGPDKSINAF